MSEDARIFKSLLRSLLRQYKTLSTAIKQKDYSKAEMIIEGLIKDAEAGLED